MGETPKHFAASGSAYVPAIECLLQDNEACLATLLCSTVDVEALTDAKGDTPLNEAAFRGNLGMMHQLLDFGVSPTRGTTQGWTPLHAAANGGRPEAVALLLQLGADAGGVWSWRDRRSPDRQFRLGTTPLHLAAEAGSLEVAQLLLARQVEVNALQRTKVQERIEGPEESTDRERLSEVTPLDEVKDQDSPLAKRLIAAGAVHGPTFTQADQNFRRGQTLAQSKKLEAALPEFEAALQIWPKHVLAAQELAHSLALLSAVTPAGDCNRSWAARTVPAIQRLLELDPEGGKKALAHPAFDGLRPFDFFLKLQGIDFESATDLEPFIAGKIFRSSCPGSSYCPVYEVTLHRDHLYTETYDRDPAGIEHCLSTGSCTPNFARDASTGRWQVKGSELQLLQNGAVVETLKIEWPDQVAQLHWPDPNDMSGEYRDDREGCFIPEE